MLRSIDAWSEQRLRSGELVIRVAIGIHHGPIAQGDVGSDSRLELTVVGDTVNIASRVEAFCRTLDAEILVTASFVEALLAEGSGKLAATFDDLGSHMLRGRAEPIHLYGLRRPAARHADGCSPDQPRLARTA